MSRLPCLTCRNQQKSRNHNPKGAKGVNKSEDDFLFIVYFILYKNLIRELNKSECDLLFIVFKGHGVEQERC